MQEHQSENRNFDFSSVRSFGWRREFDFQPFSQEFCMHTEGYIDLFHQGQVYRPCWYLLEFFLETKTALMRHFGGTTFEAKVALPLSGGGYVVVKARDGVKMSIGGDVILSSDWNGFLSDFLNFERRLLKALQRHFPVMSSTKEFALIF